MSVIVIILYISKNCVANDFTKEFLTNYGLEKLGFEMVH
jgi:hypothetical protein